MDKEVIFVFFHQNYVMPLETHVCTDSNLLTIDKST